MGRLAGKGLKLATGIGAATAAMGVFAGIKFIKDSSRAAADFEKMALGFTSIMGSADAAAKRLKDIQEFSIKTPFEPGELMRASKVLQALAGDTAAIGEGLTMVADASASTGEDLEMVATNVGLLFQALTKGGELGEASNQLMKLGILSADVKGEMKSLFDAAKKGEKGWLDSAEALEMIQRGLSRSKGAMEDFSQSVVGKVSTMKGHFEMLQIAFGEGINKGLVFGIDAMNRKIPEMIEGAKKLGDAIGLGIGQAIQGNTKLLELQVTFLFQKLAEIGAGVFTQAIGTFMGGILPKIMQEKTRWFYEDTTLGKFMGGLQPGVRNATMGIWKGMEQPMADLFDFGDFQKMWAGEFGSGDKLDEVIAELKGIRNERLKDAPGWLKAWGGPMIEDKWLDLKYQ